MDEVKPVWHHFVIDGPNQVEYPGQYVIRRWRIAIPDPIDEGIVGLAPSLRAARRLVPPGQHRIVRHPSDDPSILETWI